MTSEKIRALQDALRLDPDNHIIRLMLAELLAGIGLTAEALTHYAELLDLAQLPNDKFLTVAELAFELGDLEFCARCCAEAQAAGVIEGIAALQTKVMKRFSNDGNAQVVIPATDTTPAFLIYDDFANEQEITFVDVGGLDEIKKIINRMIILPQARPDLYSKYKRSSGGGVMLYGPPGCGKTMLARATAGECGLPFYSMRIADTLGYYQGETEKNISEVFHMARSVAPCVLFIDELDAFAFARRKSSRRIGHTIVDQLLQELDSIGLENKGLLILAASNAPWDIDDAILRPGRFDRRIFVPPPDTTARRTIFERLLRDVPNEGIDLSKVVKATALFSGADLRALVEQSIDLVIEEALDTNTSPPLSEKHLDATLKNLRPTTLDWLLRSQNYVEFANQDERYADVAAFLRSSEVKKIRNLYKS